MSERENIEVKIEKHVWPDEKKAANAIARRRILLFLLAILIFYTGWGFRGLLQPTGGSSNENNRFNQMLNIMSSDWYYAGEEDFNKNELYNRSMRGMATIDFDPHTQFFSREELAEFEQGVNQTYSGIGVEMNMDTDYPLIINVFYNTPAENAGLKVGDYIIEVDGIDVKGMTYEELKPLVLGEPGTKINIVYKRGDKQVSLELIRANISYTVDFKILKNEIGYITISTFGTSTPSEFNHALQELSDNNIKKLIIDLRENGGGYLDALIRMADYLLPKDKLIFTQQYIGNKTIDYQTKTDSYFSFEEMILLTNGNTASAAEVLASTLKDNGVARIVGEITYGKGTSQNIYSFSDGSALKYTQTQWFTANGQLIHGKGIEPDYQVSLPEFLVMPTPVFEENEKIVFDQVSPVIAYIQSGLEMLGYPIDRKDGYFSKVTLTCINKFQEDNKLKTQNFVDSEAFMRFIAICRLYYQENEITLDTQLAKAIELLS